MACCKCCCGNKDCAEGDQGKCCCGSGETRACCTPEQYCCDGGCQDTPCLGACCDPVFGCSLTTEADCAEIEGAVFMGPSTTCDPDPCVDCECGFLTPEGCFQWPFGFESAGEIFLAFLTIEWCGLAIPSSKTGIPPTYDFESDNGLPGDNVRWMKDLSQPYAPFHFLIGCNFNEATQEWSLGGYFVTTAYDERSGSEGTYEVEWRWDYPFSRIAGGSTEADVYPDVKYDTPGGTAVLGCVATDPPVVTLTFP